MRIEWIPTAFASTVLHAFVEIDGLPMINNQTVCGQKIPDEISKFDHFNYRKCKICERILKRKRRRK